MTKKSDELDYQFRNFFKRVTKSIDKILFDWGHKSERKKKKTKRTEPNQTSIFRQGRCDK